MVSSAKEAFTISSDSLAYFAVGPSSPRAAPVAEAPSSRRDTTPDVSAWSALIDGQLASWAQNPASLEDDDLLAPSLSTIRKASLGAASLRDHGTPLPTRIVPTGDGGIAIQFARDREFISIEIEPEGVVELLVFEEGRLKHRAAL
jgi:hypothetical protein